MYRSEPNINARMHVEPAHCLVSHDGWIVRIEGEEPRCERIAAGIEAPMVCTIEHEQILLHPDNDPGGSQSRASRMFRRHWQNPAPPNHFQIVCMGRPMVVDSIGRMAPGDRGQSTFFSLVRCDTIRLVCHLLGNSWIESGSDHLIESGHIHAGPGPSLSIGGEWISFQEIEDSCFGRDDRGDPEPKDLAIRYSGWKVRRLTLYKPLIYMAAFGERGLFDCAELAIESIVKFGSYSGDIILLTSKDHGDFADTLSEDVRCRVHVVACTANDVIDFLVARFQIVNVPMAWRYQPVVYMDTDVLIDAPLAPLLKDIARSNFVHLTSLGRGTLMEDSNYYGSALFEQDATIEMSDEEGYNSGIIAFRNIGDVAGTFDRMAAAIYGYASTAAQRMFYPAADQCMANYVLYREGRGDGSLLTPWVELANHTIPLDRPARRGFVHFIGGVGNTVPKIVQMKRYLQMMSDGR